MRFTWDETKNQRNQRDHQVSFELARDVFADPLVLKYNGPGREWGAAVANRGHGRGHGYFAGCAYGAANDEGEEVIRIISARKATKHERRAYEEG